MQRIKAIIFDFGGVLMRTGDPAGRRAWESRLDLSVGALERLVHHSDQWNQAQVGILSADAYWAWIGQQLRISDADMQQLRIDYFRDDHLDPDLITLIKTLRRDGYLVGLLSNDTAALEDKLRHEIAIYDLFDAVRISAQISSMKPDPQAYNAICAALNIRPAEAVFIDDNPANITGAQAVGMRTIYYQAGMNLRAAIDQQLA